MGYKPDKAKEMAIANCQHCGERYHVRHWCLRAPDNWRRMSEWMQKRARDGKIIPRTQYIAIAKEEGVPSATTLEKQVAGTWRDVAEAFGLGIGETPNKQQRSRMDEARYKYDVDRDDLPAVGLTVLDKPRRDVWYSKRDGKVYEGLAWMLI